MGETIGLTKKEYEALADTSELDEYKRLKSKATRAFEAYNKTLDELDEFERDWKNECRAMGVR